MSPLTAETVTTLPPVTGVGARTILFETLDRIEKPSISGRLV